jgi:hypothetical protein
MRFQDAGEHAFRHPGTGSQDHSVSWPEEGGVGVKGEETVEPGLEV